MSKKVFITGISGFLASHIALQLLKSGASVTGSVRSKVKSDHIRAVLESHGADTSKLAFAELDLLEDRGWNEAIAGHDYLIHTASPFVTTIPKDPQELIRPAVEGTVRALNAGMAANVKRIVLTSTLGAVAYGHGKDNRDLLTEHSWTNIDGDDVTPYVLSKTLAERKAWEIMEAAGSKNLLTVINPGLILGPVLENDVGTSGGLILKMLNGNFPGAPDLCFPCVDARDTASLHINALESKEFAGRRCLATDKTVRFVDLARGLAKGFPKYARKLPTRQLPDFLVKLVALYDEDARAAAKSLGYWYNLDSSQAAKLLGRDLIATDIAARDMARSMIDLKLV